MTYRRYAAERIGASLAVLFLAASLTYVIFHVVGPVKPHAGFDTPVQAARYHRYAQESYGDYLWQLVGQGSLGRGIDSGVDDTEPAFEPAPVTLSLVGGTLIFALLVGVPLGWLWSRRRRVGRLIAQPFTYLGVSVAPIWISLPLSYLLGYKADLLPIAGYCDVFSPPRGPGECGGVADWATHLILPSIALGLALAAVYAVVTRRLLVSIARTEDARDARRLALIAFGKLVTRNASWLIGATFFVEIIFALPGLDRNILTAGSYQPYAEAILLVASMLAVGLSLAVDLVAGAFLPDWRVNEF